MAKFCAGCGAPLADNEKFCGSCGTKVEDTIPAAQNAAAQENSQNDVQNVNNVQNVQDQQNVQNFQQPDYGSPLRDPAPKAPNPGLTWVKGHKNLLIIAAAGIVVIVAAVIILMNIFKYQVIDPKDIASVQFYGVNGDGSAEVCLNNLDVMKSYYQKLVAKDDKDNYFDYDFYTEKIKSLKEEDCSKYFESKKAWTKAKNSSEAKKMQKALLKENDGEYKIKFELENKTGLKNGDKVKVTVDYDEDYLKENKIKLSSDSFEVEVEGLNDAEECDLFDGVSLESKGYNGVARLQTSRTAYYEDNYVQVNLPKSDNYEDQIFTYTVESDDSKRYSNGDKITVTAKLYGTSNVHKRKGGYWFSKNDKYYMLDKEEDTKEFEVSGLEDTKEIDVLSNVELSFNGVSPNLSASVDTSKINGESVEYGCVSYRVSQSSDLKINDKVKIYAKVDLSDMAKKGYKPSGDANSSGENFYGDDWDYYSDYYSEDDGYAYYEKEYTIDSSNCPYMISSKEDAIAAENALKIKYNSGLNNVKKSSYVDVYTSTDDYQFISCDKFVSATYVGSVVSSTTDEDAYTKNYVAKIYKIEYKDNDNKSHVNYAMVALKNVEKEGDEYKTYYKGDTAVTKVFGNTSVLYSYLQKYDDHKYTLVKYKNTAK